MNFHSPARPRLGNGNPAWLTAPQIALPGIYVTPSPDSWAYGCEVVVEGSWWGTVLSLGELSRMLLEWEQDPETALKTWFKIDPPEPRQASSSKAQAPAEVLVTTASAEELGL